MRFFASLVVPAALLAVFILLGSALGTSEASTGVVGPGDSDYTIVASVLGADSDGDGVEDGDDNCPSNYNPGQQDTDDDGDGDVCDSDDDGDGKNDDVDNCPKTYNPGQGDMDGDGRGDACDQDKDGDGHSNSKEWLYGSNDNNASSTPEHIMVAGTCSDNSDNDGDGLTDGSDPGCQAQPIFDDHLEVHTLTHLKTTADFEVVIPSEGISDTVVVRGDVSVLTTGWEEYGEPDSGTYEIPLEIISLDLKSTAPITVTGGGPTSTGMITDTNIDPNYDFPAESFFDVYFDPFYYEGDGPWHTEEPMHLEATALINQLPPPAADYVPPDTPVYLYNEDGEIEGDVGPGACPANCATIDVTNLHVTGADKYVDRIELDYADGPYPGPGTLLEMVTPPDDYSAWIYDLPYLKSQNVKVSVTSVDVNDGPDVPEDSRITFLADVPRGCEGRWVTDVYWPHDILTEWGTVDPDNPMDQIDGDPVTPPGAKVLGDGDPNTIESDLHFQTLDYDLVEDLSPPADALDLLRFFEFHCYYDAIDGFDDDGDGAIDEDPVDGIDNDDPLDGLVDEDPPGFVFTFYNKIEPKETPDPDLANNWYKATMMVDSLPNADVAITSWRAPLVVTMVEGEYVDVWASEGKHNDGPQDTESWATWIADPLGNPVTLTWLMSGTMIDEFWVPLPVSNDIVVERPLRIQGLVPGGPYEVLLTNDESIEFRDPVTQNPMSDPDKSNNIATTSIDVYVLPLVGGAQADKEVRDVRLDDATGYPDTEGAPLVWLSEVPADRTTTWEYGPYPLVYLKSQNEKVSVISEDWNNGPDLVNDAYVSFLANVPLGCEGRWIPQGGDILTMNGWVNTSNPMDQLEGQIIDVEDPDYYEKIDGDGDHSTIESDLHFQTGPEPAGGYLDLLRFFEFHCWMDNVYDVDDDGDTLIDEDPVNGVDDDGDQHEDGTKGAPGDDECSDGINNDGDTTGSPDFYDPCDTSPDDCSPNSEPDPDCLNTANPGFDEDGEGFLFEFYNKIEPKDAEDTNMGNNWWKANLWVDSYPNGDVDIVSFISDLAQPIQTIVSTWRHIGIREFKHNWGPQDVTAAASWSISPESHDDLNVRWVAQPGDICTYQGINVPCGEGGVAGVPWDPASLPNPPPAGVDSCQDGINNDGDTGSGGEDLCDMVADACSAGSAPDPDCLDIDIDDLHFPVTLPVSVEVEVYRELKVHANVAGTYNLTLWNYEYPEEGTWDPNPDNNELSLDLTIEGWDSPPQADKRVNGIDLDYGDNYPDPGPLMPDISMEPPPRTTEYEYDREYLKSNNVLISVTSWDELESGDIPPDSYVSFLADIPLDCEGRWIPETSLSSGQTDTLTTGEEIDLAQPWIQTPGTIIDPLDPLYDQKIGGDGDPATIESDLHFQTVDWNITEEVGVEIPLLRFFEFHCWEDGYKTFTFYNKIEPKTPVEDPDLLDNWWRATMQVYSTPNADKAVDDMYVDADWYAPDMYKLEVLKSQNVSVDVTSIDVNLGPEQVPPDSYVSFLADIPPECEGRWADTDPFDLHTTGGFIDLGDPMIQDDGTFIDPPAPKVFGDDNSATIESDLHFHTIDYGLVEDIYDGTPDTELSLTRTFDLHCVEDGAFTFTFYNKIEPSPPYVDPVPDNNWKAVQLLVNAAAPEVPEADKEVQNIRLDDGSGYPDSEGPALIVLGPGGTRTTEWYYGTEPYLKSQNVKMSVISEDCNRSLDEPVPDAYVSFLANVPEDCEGRWIPAGDDDGDQLVDEDGTIDEWDEDGDQNEDGSQGAPGDDQCFDTINNDGENTGFPDYFEVCDTTADACWSGSIPDPDCLYGFWVDEDPVNSYDTLTTGGWVNLSDPMDQIDGDPVDPNSGKVDGDTDEATTESDLHFYTADYGLVEEPDSCMDILRFFEFHCYVDGEKTFTFYNKIEPEDPVVDPIPGNNWWKATLVVNSLPNADVEIVGWTAPDPVEATVDEPRVILVDELKHNWGPQITESFARWTASTAGPINLRWLPGDPADTCTLDGTPVDCATAPTINDLEFWVTLDALSVDVAVQRELEITCNAGGTYTVTLTNDESIALRDPATHEAMQDPNWGNNWDQITIDVNCEAGPVESTDKMVVDLIFDQADNYPLQGTALHELDGMPVFFLPWDENFWFSVKSVEYNPGPSVPADALVNFYADIPLGCMGRWKIDLAWNGGDIPTTGGNPYALPPGSPEQLGTPEEYPHPKVEGMDIPDYYESDLHFYTSMYGIEEPLYETVEIVRFFEVYCWEPGIYWFEFCNKIEAVDVPDPNYSNNYWCEPMMVDTTMANSDGDGWLDINDNCPFTPQADQSDADFDNYGDVCDNCPATSNPDQADYDGDGLAGPPGVPPGPTDNFGGDACDPEADNDSQGLPGAGNAGFLKNTVEAVTGTDPLDDCADTATPFDEEGPGAGEPVSPWGPDFNDNGFTDIGDLVGLKNHWVPIGNPYGARYDLNGNGMCDIGDLVVLKAYWIASGHDTCPVGMP